MKCPVCASDLRAMDRSGVEIDYCPQCRGVWLDRGELEKLIDRSAGYTDSAQSGYAERQQYGGGTGEYHHGKKKKKSFLGEMFDFD